MLQIQPHQVHPIQNGGSLNLRFWVKWLVENVLIFFLGMNYISETPTIHTGCKE